jgi:uncharacterized protein YneF (UPF0154 family)
MQGSIDWIAIISITASLVAIMIGGFAIWLAVTFYRMSD